MSLGDSNKLLRTELIHEMEGTVEYDCQTLIDQLLNPGLGELVTPANLTISGDRRQYERIIKAVLEECPKELGTLRKLAGAKTKDEKAMYPPLNLVLSTITEKSFRGSSRSLPRFFMPQGNITHKIEDEATVAQPKQKPNFLLVDRQPVPSYDQISLWRVSSAFIEVRAHSTDSPTPDNRDTVKLTLSQGADYARILLSSRPHQLYVWGLFICGNAVTVALFHRRGACLSPPFDLQDLQLPPKDLPKPTQGLELFVRIVIRLVMEMSSEELGQDPSVSLLPGHTHYGSTYPSFRVRVGAGPNATNLITVGQPIWSSRSFLGRGTDIWNAVLEDTLEDDAPASVVIMKTAWRQNTSRAESEIYEEARKRLPTDIPIPQLLMGGDVVVTLNAQTAGEEHLPVSITAVRKRALGKKIVATESDATLHRLVLQDFGIPLYKYDRLETLLRAVRDALRAHEALYRVGMLHRNVSPGNIMIRTPYAQVIPTTSLEGTRYFELKINEPSPLPPGYSYGFLMGLEFVADLWDAHNDQEEAFLLPTDGMTDFGMFMATEVLFSMKERVALKHDASHDLQSFLWSIIYAVYRRALNTDVDEAQATQKDTRKEFKRLFTATSVAGLITARTIAFTQTNISARPDTDDHCAGIVNLLLYADQCGRDGEALVALLQNCWLILQSCQPVRTPNPKTRGKYFLPLELLQSYPQRPPAAAGNQDEGGGASSANPATGSDTVAPRQVQSPPWRRSVASQNLTHRFLDLLLESILLDYYPGPRTETLSEEERKEGYAGKQGGAGKRAGRGRAKGEEQDEGTEQEAGKISMPKVGSSLDEQPENPGNSLDNWVKALEPVATTRSNCK